MQFYDDRDGNYMISCYLLYLHTCGVSPVASSQTHQQVPAEPIPRELIFKPLAWRAEESFSLIRSPKRKSNESGCRCGSFQARQFIKAPVVAKNTSICLLWKMMRSEMAKKDIKAKFEVTIHEAYRLAVRLPHSILCRFLH